MISIPRMRVVVGLAWDSLQASGTGMPDTCLLR